MVSSPAPSTAHETSAIVRSGLGSHVKYGSFSCHTSTETGNLTPRNANGSTGGSAASVNDAVIPNRNPMRHMQPPRRHPGPFFFSMLNKATYCVADDRSDRHEMGLG